MKKKIFLLIFFTLVSFILYSCDRQTTSATTIVTSTNLTTISSTNNTTLPSSNPTTFTSEPQLTTTVGSPRIRNLAITPGANAGSISVYIAALSSSSQIYYIVTEYEATTPTTLEVVSGINYQDVTVIVAGSATYQVYTLINDFDEAKTYMVHIVLEEKGVYTDVISRRTTTKNQFEAGTFGNGTDIDPFQIHSYWQLELIATDQYGYTAEAYYIMTEDIDLADGGYGPDGKSWVPIGKQNGLNRKFSGRFDGDGHTISNLFIESTTGTEKWGLFQETAVDSTITNLHLNNVSVKVNGFRIAALVGYSKGNISNIAVTNAIIEQTAGEGQVGAVVGAFYDTGSMYQVYSDAQVIATGRRVGGLIGAATTNAGFDTVRISDVAFTGSVSGTEATSRQFGGILGAGTGVLLSNAYSSAQVSGVRQIGGVIGYVEGSGTVTSIIKDCIYNGSGVLANALDEYTTIGIGLILGDASITKGPFEVINCFSSTASTITTTGNPSSRQTDGTSSAPEDFGLLIFYETSLPTWNLSYVWILNSQNVPSLRLASLQGE